MVHDFNDPLNEDPGCSEIKVRPAVEASWVAQECQFDGIFGACGEFTRRQPPPETVPPIVNLLPLASARDQFLHRVRYPAGRVCRRARPRPE